MSKYKNKMCYPRLNKKGEIISYRFYFSGKDPMTGKHKNYTKTWKVPKGLTQKEIELERKKAEIEFINESEKKSNGVFVSENNIRFDEFAEQWLEEIKLREGSYGSYASAKNHLGIILEWFGQYQLKNISPVLIQKFYNYLCTRTYSKTCVFVKKSIKELFDKGKIPQYKIAESCGINRLTLRLASTVGNQVSMATAKAVCNHFKVSIDKYFSIENQEVKFSCATNKGIRTTLVMILNAVKKRMLIEHNYATKEYTNPVTGTTKEKEIFNEEEAKEFLRLVMEETDIRKKTIFSLFIFLGLRNAEVCGLEWKDIDLDNGILKIQRNSLYFREFGVVTKAPKTQNSKRTITMPAQLTDILRQYNIWWEEQKVLHGDLWENADRLFLQDNGEAIHPCTPRVWLDKFEAKHGLRHVPPHALRHTNITLQLLAGVPIKAVSQRAGHSNENITLNIYTHLLQEEDKRAALTFDNFMSL